MLVRVYLSTLALTLMREVAEPPTGVVMKR